MDRGVPVKQQALLDAIYVRNKVNSGMADRQWIVEQIVRLASEEVWTDPQIGAIVGYAPGSVRRQVVRANARVGQKPIEGGKLNASALDLMLTLTGDVNKVQQANLLTETIKTGTSTKLIARVTGISLGLVLYQQRKLKKDMNHGFAREPELDEVPGM